MNMRGARPLNRLPVKAGPEAFKTYQIVAPLKTHWRPATCDEVDCQKRAKGFQAQIDVSTDLGRRQAHYIENLAGLRYRRQVMGMMVIYTFPAGQRCFDPHKVPLEREPLYIVRGGDHRGNPRGTPKRAHRTGSLWVEDFAEHQDRIATAIERG